MSDRTIFALASGPGRSAVAIVRLSGPFAGEALRRVTGRLPPPRVATLADVVDPTTGKRLDRALALWFPAPRSFTGEDCAELHLHGGRAVVAATLAALAGLPGCRLAEPGEFTRRAFLNGKLDLAAVEGLADLIEAETEAQRKQALHHLDGALGRWVGALRKSLLEALALTESAIDFADEADVSVLALVEAKALARTIADRIGTELARRQAGERVREGFVVTLAGPPNAGKSTLLNALARRDAAIVSPHAGTTRDPIEVQLDLGGYAVRVIDTAGIRDTADPVEREGVARAWARARDADRVLWLQDCRDAPMPPTEQGSAPIWLVGTKADLATAVRDGFEFRISAETGLGMSELVARLQVEIAGSVAGGETALVTRLRHRQALEAAHAALCRLHGVELEAELMAENLRSAADALGRITGRIEVEEILGEIFGRFCIGK